MSDENKITIEVFPAKKGDSFLIHLDAINLLIDCGYSETYFDFIKPRLEALKSQNEKLDRLIITHIDQDHISGATNLLKENIDTTVNKIVEIAQVWHNSYRHLDIDKINEEVSAESKAILESLPKKGISNKEEKAISAKQGSSLAAQLLAGNYKWNSDFNGNAVSNMSPEIMINDKVKIIMLSPAKENLLKLQKFWRRELMKLGFNGKMVNNELFDDAFEFLLLQEKKKITSSPDKQVSSKKISIENLKNVIFSEDQSPTNGSSMAFIIEYNDKKLLFLGDSHPSVIIESLKKNYQKKDFPVQFDLIKISHHGSFANNNPVLLKMIDSPRFIISTNGSEHGHPDLETLAWIVGRKAKIKRCLYFNYSHSGTVFLDNKDLQQKYNYEIVIAENDKSLKIEI